MSVVLASVARWFARLALLVLVATAVAVSLLRLGLSEAERWRPAVERELAARFGSAVSVDSLHGRLAGLSPVITLSGLRVGSGDDRLEARRLRLVVSLWESLANGEIRVAEMTLTGTVVQVSGRPRLPPVAPAAVLPDRIDVPGARLSWRDPSGAHELELSDVDLRLERSADRLRLSADGRMRFADGAPFTLAADTTLKPQRAGRAYLQAEGLNLSPLAPLLKALELEPLGHPVGDGGAEVWFDWRDGEPRQAVARFDLNSPGRDGHAAFSRVAGIARWEPREAGWSATLRLDALDTLDDRSLAPIHVSVTRDATHWQADLARMPLVELLRLARNHLPSHWSTRLAGARPVGVVNDLALRWASADDWRASGRLAGFGIVPVMTDQWRLPGVSGMDLALDMGPDGGRFRLEGSDGALELPWLFREPLPFAAVAGSGGWSRAADGRVHVHAPELRARGNDGDVSASVDVWAGAGRTPFLDLRARLEDGRAGETSRYLPAVIMPDPLVRWLDGALDGGRVAHADLTLFGPAGAFPFRHGEGMFEVRAEVSDARFAYQPGWPSLEDVAGEVRFRDESMRIELRDGRLRGARLEWAVARIPDLAAPELDVEGRLRGAGRDMLGFLLDSPITADETRLLSRFDLEGEHTLELGLGIFFDGRPIEVDGRLLLEDGTLALRDTPYRIDNLGGRVDFDRHGLSWDGIEGRFAGAPLLSRAVTEGEGDDTRIVSNTRFRAPLAGLLPESPALDAVSGEASWLLTVDAAGFGAESADYELMLDSDLQGVRVEAPEPFGKPAERARRLALSASFDGDTAGPLRLHYGGVLSAIAELASEGLALRRLGLRLGDGDARLPDAPGTRLTGTLERMTGLKGSDAPRLPPIPPLRELDLALPPLTIAGFRLAPLRVVGARDEDRWRLRLDGAAAGTLEWQGGLRPDAVDFDLVRLNLETVTAPPPEDGDASPDDAPASVLPALSGKVDRLTLDQRPLGRVEMSSTRRGRSLELESLRLENEGLRLGLRGGWDAAEDRSRVTLDAEIANAGSLLERLGQARVLDGGDGSVVFAAEWPGGLLAPSLESLQGTLDLAFRDGSLVAVEPGAGRLVGLFSVALVPRRLGFDFSDVTEAGFVFDTLSAEFALADGIARTDDFSIDGPAASIRVEGPIDLVRRRYDQTVTVVPRVSATLPIIGGLAGGPQVALVLLVVNQLFGDGVDQLSQFRYRIEGDWDAPNLRALPDREEPADPDRPAGSPAGSRP